MTAAGTYLVTPTDTRTPPGRFTATDPVDLGQQVATYLTNRGLMSRGVRFDAQIGTDRGAFRQAGRVITFTITRES